jgi:hypothetical protein
MPDALSDEFVLATFDICEHGLSAWLCAHPIYHYPTDEMMNSGRYY